MYETKITVTIKGKPVRFLWSEMFWALTITMQYHVYDNVLQFSESLPLKVCVIILLKSHKSLQFYQLYASISYEVIFVSNYILIKISIK